VGSKLLIQTDDYYPSLWYLYLVEGWYWVRGLMWPNDPKSYANGSISHW
jgi:hypothetical protein